jgi:hypothetical protein
LSEARAAYVTKPRLTPEEEFERKFLLSMLNGLTEQAAALEKQRAGVLCQAEAIREKLGIRNGGNR